MVVLRLAFTDNKRDFVQLKFIYKWMEENGMKNIPQCALYDALEERFHDNYNARYRDVNTKIGASVQRNVFSSEILVFNSYHLVVTFDLISI